MMVKVLLLEQWYVLSDPQMEEALRDRISFRRFVGLDLQDHTPATPHQSLPHSVGREAERGAIPGVGATAKGTWCGLEEGYPDGCHAGGSPSA